MHVGVFAAARHVRQAALRLHDGIAVCTDNRLTVVIQHRHLALVLLQGIGLLRQVRSLQRLQRAAVGWVGLGDQPRVAVVLVVGGANPVDELVLDQRPLVHADKGYPKHGGGVQLLGVLHAGIGLCRLLQQLSCQVGIPEQVECRVRDGADSVEETLGDHSDVPGFEEPHHTHQWGGELSQHPVRDDRSRRTIILREQRPEHRNVVEEDCVLVTEVVCSFLRVVDVVEVQVARLPPPPLFFLVLTAQAENTGTHHAEREQPCLRHHAAHEQPGQVEGFDDVVVVHRLELQVRVFATPTHDPRTPRVLPTGQ